MKILILILSLFLNFSRSIDYEKKINEMFGSNRSSNSENDKKNYERRSEDHQYSRDAYENWRLKNAEQHEVTKNLLRTYTNMRIENEYKDFGPINSETREYWSGLSENNQKLNEEREKIFQLKFQKPKQMTLLPLSQMQKFKANLKEKLKNETKKNPPIQEKKSSLLLPAKNDLQLESQPLEIKQLPTYELSKHIFGVSKNLPKTPQYTPPPNPSNNQINTFYPSPTNLPNFQNGQMYPFPPATNFDGQNPLADGQVNPFGNQMANLDVESAGKIVNWLLNNVESSKINQKKKSGKEKSEDKDEKSDEEENDDEDEKEEDNEKKSKSKKRKSIAVSSEQDDENNEDQENEEKDNISDEKKSKNLLLSKTLKKMLSKPKLSNSKKSKLKKMLELAKDLEADVAEKKSKKNKEKENQKINEDIDDFISKSLMDSDHEKIGKKDEDNDDESVIRLVAHKSPKAREIKENEGNSFLFFRKKGNNENKDEQKVSELNDTILVSQNSNEGKSKNDQSKVLNTVNSNLEIENNTNKSESQKKKKTIIIIH